MNYLALHTISTDTAQPDITETESDAWDEVIELIFDDKTKQFAEILKRKGIQPGEPGYEVTDDNGEVIATIELAWPELKIGFLAEEQQDDKEKLENSGWTIIDDAESVDLSIFGGDTNE